MSQSSQRGILTYQGIPIWRDDRVIKGVAQVVSAIVVIGFLIFFVRNVISAAELRGLSLGYDFLEESAGFPIGEGVIEYDPSMSFLRAFLVGVLNTLKVSLIGIVLATILGIIVGVARLSSNWLIRSMASVYVEVLRNVPLLVTLFFLFFGVSQQLPSVQESINIANLMYINQRGVFMVSLVANTTAGLWLMVLAIAVIVAVILWIVLNRRQIQSGQPTYAGWWALGVLILVPLATWLIVSPQPFTTDVPVLGRFNYEGGTTLTTQFAALLLGLTIYTAAFIAEIVRAGIQSVSRGQVEAARSIGLKPMQSLRLVIFPQAMRVVIPPLISQYLNLTKNSSLAIAIGYPDLFAVGRIMINQAGRAVPVFLMIMGTYLLISLMYSIILNIYNRRISFEER